MYHFHLKSTPSLLRKNIHLNKSRNPSLHQNLIYLDESLQQEILHLLNTEYVYNVLNEIASESKHSKSSHQKMLFCGDIKALEWDYFLTLS